MTHLIWSIAFFAAFMLGVQISLAHIPEDAPGRWHLLVLIPAYTCLICSIISAGFFIWPIYSGIGG